jgi:hypothetical protein
MCPRSYRKRAALSKGKTPFFHSFVVQLIF